MSTGGSSSSSALKIRAHRRGLPNGLKEGGRGRAPLHYFTTQPTTNTPASQHFVVLESHTQPRRSEDSIDPRGTGRGYAATEDSVFENDKNIRQSSMIWSCIIVGGVIHQRID